MWRRVEAEKGAGYRLFFFKKGLSLNLELISAMGSSNLNNPASALLKGQITGIC